MANLFNSEFQSFLQVLNEAGVKYVLVGGYSVIFHGYPRTTGDLNVFVKVDKKNYEALTVAFKSFKLPMFDLTKDNFLFNDDIDVFRFGRPPVSIEILKSISGLQFEDVYEQALNTKIDGIKLRIISLNQLKINKKSSGRHKDLDDLENL